MTTETMTIHKALCELKVLNKRIIDKIQDLTPVATIREINKNSIDKNSPKNPDRFKQTEKEKYQSIVDLIARRDAIKRAVILSNATTKVIIGDKEYTVAEAIDAKNNGIELYRHLLNHLTRMYREANNLCESNNRNVENKADEYVKNLFSAKDDTQSENALKAREEFIKSQSFSIVDAIGIEEEIKKYDSLISQFNIDIDSALSVSNAITEIEVTY